MKKTLLLATACLTCSLSLWSEGGLKRLKTGKLPSGLTYYIYPTDYTPDEAHFYLVQDVGGVVEEDKQQGLAHYLEHLAFNATKHFPDGIMNFFLRRGIRSFDAKTGINETRYQINSIPTNDKALVDSSLLILRDWCDGILIRPEDVEKEKRIVTEEWRTRSGIDSRLTESIAPAIYNGAKYSVRNVIGREDLIRNYTAKDLKRFYEQWYKPSLQCVMVIGDINPEEIEAKLLKTFASMSKPKHAPTRTPIVIPTNSRPIFYAFVDKENTSPSFGLYQRVDAPTSPEKRDYAQANLYTMLFNSLAPRLFTRLRNDGREAAIATTVGYNPLVRLYDQCAWDVVPYPGKEQEALEQMLAMRERLKRVGFTEQEFEEQRQTMVNDLTAMLQESNLEAPNNMMDLFRQNFLYRVPLRPIKEQVNETLERLLEMDLDEFNNWMKSWLTDDNLAFITYTSRAGELNLSQKDFELALSKAKTAPLLQFAEPKKIDKLIDFEVKAGTIKSEKSLADLGGTKEWTLSNGAKFYYKHVPEMKGQFYFVASSHGGRSVVKQSDLPSFTAMQSLIMRSGVHRFNRNDLYTWLKNKSIELNITIDNYTEGLGGNASSSEVEDFFQYLHLVLMRQRLEKADFDKYVSQQKYLYLHPNKTPRDIVQDSIQSLLFPHTAENPKQDAAFFDAMKHEDLLRLFRERLVSAQDFNYCLVGDVPEAVVKDLASKYVASLPRGEQKAKEVSKILDFSSPEKHIKREFVADIPGQIGELELSYDVQASLSDKEQLLLPVLETYLQNLLFEEIRERAQLTYSIGVNAKYEELPQPSVQLNMRFASSRDKVDILKTRLYELLSGIEQGKVDADEFRKSTIPHRIEQENTAVTIEDNPMLWLVFINSYVETGVIPKLSKDNSKEKALWDSVKPADLANLYKKLTQGKTREIVVKSLPQTMELKHSY